MKIVLRKTAREELREAQKWYERQQSGLGRRFAEAVQTALERIQSNPTGFRLAYKNVREALVRGFPYVIYYCVEESRIVVFAVFHGRRDPQVWRSRVDEDV